MTDHPADSGAATTREALSVEQFRAEVQDKLSVVFNGCKASPLERVTHRKQCEDFLVERYAEAASRAPDAPVREGAAMIPKGKGLPKYADDSTLNQIRGKAMVGHQTIEDVWTLLDHLQLLEHILDEEIDPNDALGPSGWREHAEAASVQWDNQRRRHDA